MLVSDVTIVSDHKFAYLLSKNTAHSARAPCIARALKTARAARSVVNFLWCSHLQNYVTTKGIKRFWYHLYSNTCKSKSKHSNSEKKETKTNKQEQQIQNSNAEPTQAFLMGHKGPKMFIWLMAYLQPTKYMVFKIDGFQINWRNLLLNGLFLTLHISNKGFLEPFF